MQPSVLVHGQRHGTNGLSLIQHLSATTLHEVNMLLLVTMWFWLLMDTFAPLPMAQLIMAGMTASRSISTYDEHLFLATDDYLYSLHIFLPCSLLHLLIFGLRLWISCSYRNSMLLISCWFSFSTGYIEATHSLVLPWCLTRRSRGTAEGL